MPYAIMRFAKRKRGSINSMEAHNERKKGKYKSMESKRLGLSNKNLYVVPNHLTEQLAAEALRLYPAANVLVATKKDFQTNNRKKFCSKIATGDYDIVIIGHSQFERIPLSAERQIRMLQQEIDNLVEGIAELKSDRGQQFNVKQMEATRKKLQNKLENLNKQEKKDNVVTFEELGVQCRHYISLH